MPLEKNKSRRTVMPTSSSALWLSVWLFDNGYLYSLCFYQNFLFALGTDERTTYLFLGFHLNTTSPCVSLFSFPASMRTGVPFPLPFALCCEFFALFSPARVGVLRLVVLLYRFPYSVTDY